MVLIGPVLSRVRPQEGHDDEVEMLERQLADLAAFVPASEPAVASPVAPSAAVAAATDPSQARVRTGKSPADKDQARATTKAAVSAADDISALSGVQSSRPAASTSTTAPSTAAVSSGQHAFAAEAHILSSEGRGARTAGKPSGSSPQGERRRPEPDGRLPLRSAVAVDGNAPLQVPSAVEADRRPQKATGSGAMSREGARDAPVTLSSGDRPPSMSTAAAMPAVPAESSRGAVPRRAPGPELGEDRKSSTVPTVSRMDSLDARPSGGPSFQQADVQGALGAPRAPGQAQAKPPAATVPLGTVATGMPNALPLPTVRPEAAMPVRKPTGLDSAVASTSLPPASRMDPREPTPRSSVGGSLQSHRVDPTARLEPGVAAMESTATAARSRPSVVVEPQVPVLPLASDAGGSRKPSAPLVAATAAISDGPIRPVPAPSVAANDDEDDEGMEDWERDVQRVMQKIAAEKAQEQSLRASAGNVSSAAGRPVTTAAPQPRVMADTSSAPISIPLPPSASLAPSAQPRGGSSGPQWNPFAAPASAPTATQDQFGGPKVARSAGPFSSGAARGPGDDPTAISRGKTTAPMDSTRYEGDRGAPNRAR